jgi:type III restriction enzyme
MLRNPAFDGGRLKELQPRLHCLDRRPGLAAIDTKGDHLIVEDAGRKLLFVNKVGAGPDLVIRLVTQGSWNDRFEKLGREGYSVWSLRNGKPHPVHVDTPLPRPSLRAFAPAPKSL